MVILFGRLEDDLVDYAGVVQRLVFLHGYFGVLFADGSLDVYHLLGIATIAISVAILHFRR